MEFTLGRSEDGVFVQTVQCAVQGSGLNGPGIGSSPHSSRSGDFLADVNGADRTGDATAGDVDRTGQRDSEHGCRRPGRPR